MTRRRVVVGLAAADDLVYCARLLEALHRTTTETHLVLSAAASASLGRGADAIRAQADHVYAEENQAARISSGSFLTRGMVVAPCDPGSLAAIVMGLATNLLYRAADVTLKEGRPLVVGIPVGTLARIASDTLARAAAVPGFTVLALEEPIDDAIASLLAPLQIERSSP